MAERKAEISEELRQLILMNRAGFPLPPGMPVESHGGAMAQWTPETDQRLRVLEELRPVAIWL
jgi:hypothetical protein